jgi:hypothetical protein
MAEVACYCGCSYSFYADAGTCPDCGEVATLRTRPAPASTVPATTAPATTAPASTAPASTAPASTVATGTVPGGTVPDQEPARDEAADTVARASFTPAV